MKFYSEFIIDYDTLKSNKKQAIELLNNLTIPYSIISPKPLLYKFIIKWFCFRNKINPRLIVTDKFSIIKNKINDSNKLRWYFLTLLSLSYFPNLKLFCIDNISVLGGSTIQDMEYCSFKQSINLFSSDLKYKLKEME